MWRLPAAFFALLLTTFAPPALSHDIAGGRSFMCQIQPFEEFERADAGNAESQYKVGNMLDYCRPRDETAAARYFLRSARQGHIKSALRIGRMHMYGFGVERDDRKAYFWLTVGKRLFDKAKTPPEGLGPKLEYVESDLKFLEKSLSAEDIADLRAQAMQWQAMPEKSPKR